MSLQMKAHYRVTVTDSRGRVIRRSRWRLSRSFVANYLRSINCITRFANVSGVIDTGGTSRTLETNQTRKLEMAAGTGVSAFGPVVGTGAAPVAITNTALAAQVVHGSGAGQLQYQAAVFGDVAVGATEASYLITRVFINGSGASITINEVGLYFQHNGPGAIVAYFLGVRDLVPGGQLVPPGGAATLAYQMRVSV